MDKAKSIYIMSASTLFVGVVGYMIASAFTKDNNIRLLAGFGGLIVGGSVSAGIIKKSCTLP